MCWVKDSWRGYGARVGRVDFEEKYAFCELFFVVKGDAGKVLGKGDMGEVLGKGHTGNVLGKGDTGKVLEGVNRIGTVQECDARAVGGEIKCWSNQNEQWWGEELVGATGGSGDRGMVGRQRMVGRSGMVRRPGDGGTTGGWLRIRTFAFLSI